VGNAGSYLVNNTGSSYYDAAEVEVRRGTLGDFHRLLKFA
jgi:hypothetical protein